MRGVLLVRLLLVSSIVCIILGSIFYLETMDDEEAFETSSDDAFSENSAPTATDSEPLREDNSDNEKLKTTPRNNFVNLIFLGAGGLTSLLVGFLFSEIFKITLLISLITPLISKTNSGNDLLTRGRILGFIESNAGIHFSALRDYLGLANGVTAYHLQVLENKGKIISWKDGKLRRYAVSQISVKDLDKVRNPIMGTRLAILEILSKSGNLGLSNSEISKKLSISRQLMSYHITELRKYEYINADNFSKRPKWKLTDLGNNALKSSYSLEIID